MLAQNQSLRMKTTFQPIPQPAPVTPGLSKAAVREHAFRLYRDKLERDALTLEDWVLAEKDLVQALDEERVEA